MFELRCRPEISRSLSSGFVHVDRKIPERSSRTLGSLLARTALLARSYIAERAVPLIASAVVQLLACRAEVTVAIRQVGKALRTIEGTPGSPDSIPGGHVRRNLPVHQTTAKIHHCHSSHRRRWTPASCLAIGRSERSCPLRLETPRSGGRLSLARPQRYSCGYQPGSCRNTPCVPACRLSSHRWRLDRWRTPCPGYASAPLLGSAFQAQPGTRAPFG